MRTSQPREILPFIDYFRITHNTPCMPLNFAYVIVFKCSWENAVLPGAFENNNLGHFFLFFGGGGGWGGKQNVLCGIRK